MGPENPHPYAETLSSINPSGSAPSFCSEAPKKLTFIV
ncbi:hypothetical protein B0O95_106119 [Mycetohabitans endofungorum]|uniref:Uncharacterized protein n=1 Tax=Mycetohabitans endofungorum TaxID=417203 RepID=A0A2P5KAI1_9BURK|nr:hypothetical protein B0O95_106119 [Mycetohabitans endofungorum]